MALNYCCWSEWTLHLYPALGTKYPASEESVISWDNKRLNPGDVNNNNLVIIQARFWCFCILNIIKQCFFIICKINGRRNSYKGFEQQAGYNYDQAAGEYSKYADADFMIGSMQGNIHSSHQRMPASHGKGWYWFLIIWYAFLHFGLSWWSL